MSKRLCIECRHYGEWAEYGEVYGDCEHKVWGNHIFRERLLDWGVQPAQYCPGFEYLERVREEPIDLDGLFNDMVDAAIGRRERHANVR